MATQSGQFTYNELCDMPACMCEGCPIFLFLRDGLLTSETKPYIIGTITQIEQLSTGAVEITFTYDDATLPTVEIEEEEVPIEITFGEDGTVCDPDCGVECSWIAKMLAVIGAAPVSGLQNRHYILYTDNQGVEDGEFSIPRIPFPSGFQLTSVKLTCFDYNENVEGNFQLKVNGVGIAAYSGNLAEQMTMTIAPGLEIIAYDDMPVLQIADITALVYGQDAQGLVLELIGVIPA